MEFLMTMSGTTIGIVVTLVALVAALIFGKFLVAGSKPMWRESKLRFHSLAGFKIGGRVIIDRLGKMLGRAGKIGTILSFFSCDEAVLDMGSHTVKRKLHRLSPAPVVVEEPMTVHELTELENRFDPTPSYSDSATAEPLPIEVAAGSPT